MIRLKDIYLISKKDIEDEYSKFQIYFKLKEQLEIAFGRDSGYVKELENRGVDKFTHYVYSNGMLPKDDVIELKNLVPQIA